MVSVSEFIYSTGSYEVRLVGTEEELVVMIDKLLNYYRENMESGIVGNAIEDLPKLGFEVNEIL